MLEVNDASAMMLASWGQFMLGNTGSQTQLFNYRKLPLLYKRSQSDIVNRKQIQLAELGTDNKTKDTVSLSFLADI